MFLYMICGSLEKQGDSSAQLPKLLVIGMTENLTARNIFEVELKK